MFRGFAFGACAQRIGDLMARIEELSDLGIDQRLAARLLAAMAPDGTVRETHAALASDIGTARQVVSRSLKQFAARGWVAMRRGEVRLVARTALARAAEGTDDVGANVTKSPTAAPVRRGMRLQQGG